MPLQLLSRSTIDTLRSQSPSPLATPTPKSQIPTIRLTTATPCESNPHNELSQAKPWITSEVSPIPLAPKPLKSGEASRRRLVPKKSKLSLLGSSAKAREQDFSDMARRTGDAPINNGSSGFEIYVDHANDPDIGEILMVKKKKSRMALDGMQWGTLGEVTNVPSVSKPAEKAQKGGKKECLLKPRVDENQKWWSIARGRKDSKEKDKGKDKYHAKSSELADQLTDVRSRFNSLDSGALLARPIDADPLVERLCVPTPPSVMLAPPVAAGTNGGKGSVALRAMRSVRSLARIGSWAQLKNTPSPDTAASAAPAKDRESDGKKKKKKRDKEKEKDRTMETIRYSGSSFEAGALTASPDGSRHESKSLGKKKMSILGLGLPSTMRLPSTRNGSTASSIVATDGANRRSSADSVSLLGGGILARTRFGSTMSTASSLRPMSTKSRESSGSSGATSVKWDEAGLQTVKEICRKDKEDRSKSRKKGEEGKEKKTKKSKGTKSEKNSVRKSSDSRRRTPLDAIFPGTLESDETDRPPLTPVLRIEAATVDGHEPAEDEAQDSPMETPMKCAHPRPASEYPLSRSRPKAIYEADDDNAVMSMLDAATNDLAQLINRLDLEATPCSGEISPMSRCAPFLLEPSPNSSSKRLVPADSPLKSLRSKNKSLVSLRPYAQSFSKSTGVNLGQNIAPWSMLNASISPSKPSPSTIKTKAQDNMVTVRTHRRTLTPAPAAEPSPVFKALRPATTRLPISKTVVGTLSGVSPFVNSTSNRSPSTLTFGSGHSKSESRGSLATSPVFKKARSFCKRSTLVPHGTLGGDNLPISPEVRRNLGLAGTMGYSVGSITEQDHDASDPDSDIPDELQVILSNSDQEGDDTLSFKHEPNHPLPSPGLPPELPLPVVNTASRKSSSTQLPAFRATVIDDDEPQVDIEEADTSSEDDTKRSFDFTGELQRLNESGASDRRSFIEQLENAFRTPAKVDLRYDFDDLPPVPKLDTLQDELSRVSESSFNLPVDYESHELSPRGFPVDVNAEPSLLPGSDSFATTASDEQLLDAIAPSIPRNSTSVATQKSNGQLNRDFKFGGKHSSSTKKESLPITFSDIIPPPEVANSLSMASFAGNESSLMKSILASAVAIESPPESSRPSAESGSHSKRETRDSDRNPYLSTSHRRSPSALSFAGFDSFAEVRRGFEFSDGRPGFYPPPGTRSDKRHRKHESMYSIASVSSYGKVLHAGSADPFEYGVPLPSLRERPSSDNFSFTMSTMVDDTFAFLRKQPHRRRVDSDASSFYFRSSLVHPYSRSCRRPESGVSIGPPISLFNRNSMYHRRGDSNASTSSIAQSYANCRHFSWSRHHRNFSVESLLSDVSATNLGRPGLGDKMLDSALERTTPLTSISASPGPSPVNCQHEERTHMEDCDRRTSYDSIIDAQLESQKTDSLFEKTGNRNSVCSSDSTFFEQDSSDIATKLPRYRPISSLSIPSVHSSPKEDDTMISMLGGGQVRRRSVTSMIGSSPCIQLEAERRKNILANPPETVFSRIKNTHLESHESPKLSRVIGTKPSIASTASSVQFGDERMIRARHGLLERQTLENTVLMGDGEDPLASFRMPVFTRPSCANRSRSSTCTSTSGADTPPLSISDGYSSFSDGSLSSIDLSQLNVLLSITSHVSSNASLERARPHGRGHGHRRRISQARASRTSIYETIQEELMSMPPPSNSPTPADTVLCSTSDTPKHGVSVTMPIKPPQVYVMDDETSSVDSFSLWDDERGITALRRYYALRDEAEDTVIESKRTWLDTPLSVFDLQSFEPPRHRSGMQAMLEHSLQNYGPLPSELRPRRVRSRVSSRPSPYPRTIKTSFTSSPSIEHLRAAVTDSLIASNENRQVSPFSNPLQQITINPNLPSTMSAGAKERAMSPDKPERVFGLPPRPRLGSATRRTGLGWSKKSTGRTSIENKENTSIRAPPSVNVSQGTIVTPADGLRLNRPRPKGRPTPASVRPFRV